MNYYKTVCLLFSITLLGLSCTDRNRNFGGLSYDLKNTTNSHIQILDYWGNGQDGEDVIISPYSSVQITRNVGSGIVSFANKIDLSLNSSNQISVVFNDTDTVRHYNDHEVHTGKYLNLSSDRCLYNTSAYIIQKKGVPYETATYTFTQADYEFAKE